MPARAALATRSPGQPGARWRALSEEALGKKRLGIGVQPRIVVHQIGAAEQLNRRMVGPAADLDRPYDRSRGNEQERRPVSQRLLDRRVHVLIARPGVDLLDQPVLDGRVVRQQLERPRERRGRVSCPAMITDTRLSRT